MLRVLLSFLLFLSAFNTYSTLIPSKNANEKIYRTCVRTISSLYGMRTFCLAMPQVIGYDVLLNRISELLPLIPAEEMVISDRGVLVWKNSSSVRITKSTNITLFDLRDKPELLAKVAYLKQKLTRFEELKYPSRDLFIELYKEALAIGPILHSSFAGPLQKLFETSFQDWASAINERNSQATKNLSTENSEFSKLTNEMLDELKLELDNLDEEIGTMLALVPKKDDDDKSNFFTFLGTPAEDFIPQYFLSHDIQQDLVFCWLTNKSAFLKSLFALFSSRGDDQLAHYIFLEQEKLKNWTYGQVEQHNTNYLSSGKYATKDTHSPLIIFLRPHDSEVLREKFIEEQFSHYKNQMIKDPRQWTHFWKSFLSFGFSHMQVQEILKDKLNYTGNSSYEEETALIETIKENYSNDVYIFNLLPSMINNQQLSARSLQEFFELFISPTSNEKFFLIDRFMDHLAEPTYENRLESYRVLNTLSTQELIFITSFFIKSVKEFSFQELQEIIQFGLKVFKELDRDLQKSFLDSVHYATRRITLNPAQFLSMVAQIKIDLDRARSLSAKKWEAELALIRPIKSEQETQKSQKRVAVQRPQTYKEDREEKIKSLAALGEIYVPCFYNIYESAMSIPEPIRERVLSLAGRIRPPKFIDHEKLIALLENVAKDPEKCEQHEEALRSALVPMQYYSSEAKLVNDIFEKVFSHESVGKVPSLLSTANKIDDA
jgi:hypothetical protein